jgi:hypothetical protein
VSGSFSEYSIALRAEVEALITLPREMTLMNVDYWGAVNFFAVIIGH